MSFLLVSEQRPSKALFQAHQTKKSLLETNPYLKDPAQRKKLLRRSLMSSFAIEGIYLEEEPTDSVKEETSSFTARRLISSSR